MNVLVFMPIDTIVKAWARQLQADGHAVETTFAFSTFLKGVRRADWALVNVSKDDSPKYIWKLLLGLLWARLWRRRAALFISIDAVDLCDRPILRAALRLINWIMFHCATRVFLLAGRAHIARRYGLASRKVQLVFNCPDRELFGGKGERKDERNERDKLKSEPGMITFLYHGELLWWHGLERFLPILEEIQKRRPARLIVTGNFYPSVFRVFGLAASRREIEVKRRLADLLRRNDVDYRGHVPIEQLRQLMAEADFHVSLMNDEDVQARTELRTGLLEAMAEGMVCLHAATPALSPDVFRDGENIVLLEPGNPAAAAEKILALADSPERLEAIRLQARQTVRAHFAMERQYTMAVAAMET